MGVFQATTAVSGELSGGAGVKRGVRTHYRAQTPSGLHRWMISCAKLGEQSKMNSSRWYLGVDDEEELLWSTTHGQLARLLRMDSIQHCLRHLCVMSREILARRVESIAQVRNVLAHNRAISEESLTVLRGDLHVIRAAVKAV
jgi:hypothetical protein